MNIRVIAYGLLLADMFNRKVEKAMLMNQVRAKYAAREIMLYLSSITPVRSGFMRTQTKVWDFKRRGQWGFSFFVGWKSGEFPDVFYAPYVCHGTGLYGRSRSQIKPLYAKRLAWEYRGRWVSAESVSGQRPKPILKATEKMGLMLLRRDFYKSFIRAFRTK